MSGPFIVNGELTENAIITSDLLRRMTVEVGPIIPIRNNDEETANDKASSQPSRNTQYYQRFLEFLYPPSAGSGAVKSPAVTIPNVVVYLKMDDYFGKTAVSFGVPMWVVNELKVKISAAGGSAEFRDRKLSSDDKYWWTRVNFNEAEEGKEYIRTIDDETDEEIYYGSFPDFFAEYPTTVVANITCSIKMICGIPRAKDQNEQREPQKSDQWRAALKISMVTPNDAIDVPAPQSGNIQRSIAGKKDKMKAGLKKFAVAN